MSEKELEIINHYGITTQLKYIHTEYYELDEAILNEINDDETYYEQVEEYHKKHIAEEIADVMVMLNQFKVYYGIDDKEIESIMNKKIERQLERIKNE